MKVFLLAVFFLLGFIGSAQGIANYKSLDPKQPIYFRGDYIVFAGKKVALGPNAFFIDGQLPDALTARYPYVFNSVNKAAEKLKHGTEASPMVLYLAPWVYWIDNPDDTAVRIPKEGSTPYGLVIDCEWLKFHGLTTNPQHVVLACNRGQTIGAKGNFTMFRFIGQGTASENITFGNYCNVDLVFPLKPSLNRQKRASAIVQAQLIHCNGDKILARNTRFISRLNLCPFVGGKRVLFDRCHFESTDDALCGTGVYLNSTLDFYSSKPFYRTTGTGAVFLNSDIKSLAGAEQFFTKAGGQVVVIDSRFTTASNTYIGWQDVVPAETKNYQAGVTLNKKPILIGRNDPASTIQLTGKHALHAYRFIYKGKTVYNTYNLLRGDDDWDPMEIKPLVLEAEKATNQSFTNIPIQLQVSPTGVTIETGKNEVQLKASLMRFGNYAYNGEKIAWSVAAKDSSLVELRESEDGNVCTVVPLNQNNEASEVVVKAFTASGLEGASVITVTPSILEAPLFTGPPMLALDAKGLVHVQYGLDTKFTDQSDIRWYRCNNAEGNDPIEVAVSRFNQPFKNYTLSVGDIGYYLMVSVAPKQIRSKSGEAVRYVMKQPISANEVKAPANLLVTDFKNLSTKNQPRILPGFWT